MILSEVGRENLLRKSFHARRHRTPEIPRRVSVSVLHRTATFSPLGRPLRSRRGLRLRPATSPIRIYGFPSRTQTGPVKQPHICPQIDQPLLISSTMFNPSHCDRALRVSVSDRCRLGLGALRVVGSIGGELPVWARGHRLTPHRPGAVWRLTKNMTLNNYTQCSPPSGDLKPLGLMKLIRPDEGMVGYDIHVQYVKTMLIDNQCICPGQPPACTPQNTICHDMPPVQTLPIRIDPTLSSSFYHLQAHLI